MKIEEVNGHKWVGVATDDGGYSISVSVNRLLYDENGRPYLLAFEGFRELRLYTTSENKE